MIIVLNDGLPGGGASPSSALRCLSTAIGELRRQGLPADSVRFLPDVVPGNMTKRFMYIKTGPRPAGGPCWRDLGVSFTTVTVRVPVVVDATGVSIAGAAPTPGQQTPPLTILWCMRQDSARESASTRRQCTASCSTTVFLETDRKIPSHL
jgi:hypothetical protein